MRAASRLTVRGARPTTLAIIRHDGPWASPRLRVSRSSIRRCVSLFFRMATPSPTQACRVALEVRTQEASKERLIYFYLGSRMLNCFDCYPSSLLYSHRIKLPVHNVQSADGAKQAEEGEYDGRLCSSFHPTKGTVLIFIFVWVRVLFSVCN